MESKKRGAGGSSSKFKSRKISALIVDDDGTLRLIHKTLLEGLFNMDTKLVKNGKEAVDLFRSGANFDVIFMDKEMPIMDGAEATKKLRAMGVKSVIVGITARAGGKEREELLAAGVNHCFEKPLTRAMVELVLQSLKKN
ncbi:hypothetical protein VNO77_18573 [Canavalia gladiata]|uniref:Response regulatory domain-containing protein n=1 Tax=Canavalia gladiata TaxID=3824 RepID=A0AAN9LL30_CANGL